VRPAMPVRRRRSERSAAPAALDRMRPARTAEDMPRLDDSKAAARRAVIPRSRASGSASGRTRPVDPPRAGRSTTVAHVRTTVHVRTTAHVRTTDRARAARPWRCQASAWLGPAAVASTASRVDRPDRGIRTVPGSASGISRCSQAV
jgi:hypothetical protein